MAASDAEKSVEAWLTTRLYSDLARAAEAWLTRHKRQRAGGQPTGPITVTPIGGGWWSVSEPGRVASRAVTKLQGFTALGRYLVSRGQLRRAEGGGVGAAYQVAPADQAASAPEAEPTPVWLTPAFCLRELERDASALLAKVGKLTETLDSARTSAALGYVKLACEELKQARIVAEVKAKYEAAERADTQWWQATRTSVQRK